MNFLPMYYYTVVVEKQSISQAAQQLHITQQTLSTHIAALEKELGSRLFERRPDFRLTYAGQVFYNYACHFTQRYSALQQEFRDIANHQQDIFKIGIAYTRGLVLLPQLLPLFHKEHPKIQIQVTETTNDILITKLTAGELDVIFADLNTELPELCSQLFSNEELLLFVPRSLLPPPQMTKLQETKDLRLLAEQPFLLSNQGQIVERMGLNLLKMAGLLPKISVTSQNIETLLALCAAGEGACFCPDLLAQRVLAPDQLNQLVTIRLGVSFPIHLAWQNTAYLSKTLRAFIQLCQHYKTLLQPPVA